MGRVIGIFIFLLLIAGVIGGGMYLYQQSQKDSGDGSILPLPTTQIETVSPTPTEIPEKIDKAKYSIQILNGSGTAGEASKAADLLKAEGYTKFTTGNADNFDFEETEIAAKSSIGSAVLADLSKILGKTYVVSSDEKKLDSESEYDIVITVGKKKAE